MNHRNISEAIALYIMSRSTDELIQLTRYEIAEKFNLHQNYLSKRFRKDLDLTILRFIDQEKVVRARILMANEGQITVDRLSALLGIAKPQQFRTKFRKVFRTTPGKLMHWAKKKE
ncbi:helix-turn-helix domain-containing protein [Pseudodesulfovibrio sp.]|uniref:helix-turn-helix domain-containing protein n=1 Tax=unclassified Pseudodesulfovibrio TaxID=2661612 RepID=UPI003B005935